MKEQQKLKKKKKGQQKQHHVWMRMNHACCCELIHKMKKRLGFYFLFRKCELFLATLNAASASIHQQKMTFVWMGSHLVKNLFQTQIEHEPSFRT